MLFTEEVKNMQELVEKLSNVENIGKIKVAVVCFIFDKNDQLILHRRGPGARDEIGKLQAIGGSVNRNDADFRDSLNRELKEEAGNNGVIEISGFIGAQLDGKVDKHTGEFVNWVILGYKGNLIEGELENMEPERCIGFEKDYIENFKKEDLSVTAYNFIQKMLTDK